MIGLFDQGIRGGGDDDYRRQYMDAAGFQCSQWGIVEALFDTIRAEGPVTRFDKALEPWIVT